MTTHPGTNHSSLLLPAAVILALLSSTATHAATEADAPDARSANPAPRVGAYALVVLGKSATTIQPGFISCICSSDHTNGGKLALGWRFGVSALEVAVLDFGAAHFRPSADFGISASEHVRALSLGGAWTARFGNRVEATWRASAALVDVTSTGGLGAMTSGSRRQWRPLWGLSIGWRFDAGPSLELGVDDLPLARDAAGGAVSSQLAPSLGLRWRF
jgi:hypothetical protein